MMKYLLSLLLIALGWQVHYGQTIGELEKTMSKGIKNGFYVELPGAEKDWAKDIWKDYLKRYAKKVKDKKDEYYTEEAAVPMINGTSEIIIYGKVQEGKGMSTLYTWVDLGGIFLNSEDYPTQAEGLEQFLADYSYMVARKVVEEEIKDEEDNYKDIRKSLEKLQNKNEDYHKDIREAQEKIREAEMNIEKNLRDQDDVRIDLEKQRRVLDKLKEKYNIIGKKS